MLILLQNYIIPVSLPSLCPVFNPSGGLQRLESPLNEDKSCVYVLKYLKTLPFCSGI